jgi:ParB family chromosome partitioning protein
MDTQPAPEKSDRQVIRVEISTLRTGKLNMRRALDPAALTELSLSFSRSGQLNPINVVRVDGGFEIVCGHRRTAAADLLGWTHLDAFIEERDDPTLWALAWAENYNRDDVAVTDQAEWLQRMKDQNGWTSHQLASVTGMSDSQVSDILGTLKYPEPLREALDAGAITLAVARAFNRIDDPATQVFYLQHACLHGCTARAAEEQVRNWKIAQMPAGDSVDELATEGAATATFLPGMHVCAACLTPTPNGVVPVYVCPSCAQTILNPQSG